MRQVRELLAQMRNYCNKQKQDDQGLLDAASVLNPRDGVQTAGQNLSQGAPSEQNGIGEVVDRGEFGLGVAPRESKPVTKIELTKEQEAELNEAQRVEPDEVSLPEEDFEN